MRARLRRVSQEARIVRGGGEGSLAWPLVVGDWGAEESVRTQ